MVDESLDGGVSFLDCWIMRGENGLITMRWWQKEISSQQVLNFHSHHQRSVKRNVIKAYIKHALFSTSPTVRYITVRKLKTTLRKSFYPSAFYERLLEKHDEDVYEIVSSIGTTDDAVSISEELKMSYVSEKAINHESESSKFCYVPFPFVDYYANGKVRRIVIKHGIKCKVVSRMENTNKKKIFSNLKNRNTLMETKYAMFNVSCTCCNFEEAGRTDNLDLMKTVKFMISHKHSRSFEHAERFGHVSEKPSRVRGFKPKSDLNVAFNLWKYQG